VYFVFKMALVHKSYNRQNPTIKLWRLDNLAGLRHTRVGHFVDRKDRRDLSLFQIGLRFIDRCLLLLLSFSLPLCSR